MKWGNSGGGGRVVLHCDREGAGGESGSASASGVLILGRKGGRR